MFIGKENEFEVIAALLPQGVNLMTDYKGLIMRTLALSAKNVHTRFTFFFLMGDWQRTCWELKFGTKQYHLTQHNDLTKHKLYLPRNKNTFPYFLNMRRYNCGSMLPEIQSAYSNPPQQVKPFLKSLVWTEHKLYGKN